MDAELDLGRLNVVMAFCDLAGYTRYTEEEGEEEALSFVESFVQAVTDTLPDDARVIKTIGDAVMIVGQDVQALTDWAVGSSTCFAIARSRGSGSTTARLSTERATPSAARSTSLRAWSRARGGEVLVTDAVVERMAESEHLAFEGVGQVKMKGFDDPVELCRAAMPA